MKQREHRTIAQYEGHEGQNVRDPGGGPIDCHVSRGSDGVDVSYFFSLL